MKTHDVSSSSRSRAFHAVASARAGLERDFATLQAQQPRVLQLALNEAEALAWETGFPELFFFTLAREKLCKLTVWQKRQQALRPDRL